MLSQGRVLASPLNPEMERHSGGGCNECYNGFCDGCCDGSVMGDMVGAVMGDIMTAVIDAMIGL